MPSFALALAWPKRDRARAVSLVAQAKAGDMGALDSLVTRYRERIVNLCFQVLRDRDAAEDAAQEAFLKAFERLPGYREDADFGTWLYKIALNICLQRRRAARRRESLAPTDAGLEEHQPHPGDFARTVEQRMALESVLDKLSEPLRLVLMLREWHGLAYEEIADVLNVPVGTVRSRLHEARSQFKRYWTEVES